MAVRLEEVVQTTQRTTGLLPVLTQAIAEGMYFDNKSQKNVVIVKNTGAGSINITIQTPATLDGDAIAERVVAVAAGVTKLIGPFHNGIYGQTGDLVYVDTDTFADTTWGVIALGAI